MTEPPSGDSPQGPQPYPQGPRAYPQGPQPYPQGPQAYPGAPPGYGQQGPAQQGYGQTPYGQAGQPPLAGQQPYQGYGQTADPALAEQWRRGVAWLLDWVILSIVSIVLLSPTFSLLARRLQRVKDRYPSLQGPGYQAAVRHVESGLGGRFLLMILVCMIVALAYFWIQTAFGAATLGKRAAGIRVVNATTRAPVSAGAAGGRSLVYIFGPVIPFFWLIDNLWLLWDPQRQCLHDKAASTVVVKKEAVGSPQAAAWGSA